MVKFNKPWNSKDFDKFKVSIEQIVGEIPWEIQEKGGISNPALQHLNKLLKNKALTIRVYYLILILYFIFIFVFVFIFIY